MIHKKVLSLFIILIQSKLVFAKSNSDELKTYRKCHAQFLSKRVSPEDRIVKLIKSNKISGLNSCMSLLEKANLSKSGKLLSITPESKQILRTFNLFHNSWFSLYELNRESQDHAVTNAIDSSQMSYHITRSLFSHTKFSDQFTTKKTLWAVREGNNLNQYSNDKDIIGKRYKLDGTGERTWQVGGITDDPEMFGDVYKWRPRLIEFGELIGFEEIKEHKDFVRLKEGKKQGRTSLTENLFNGTFGSVAYLVLNLAHDNKTTDGGNILHRRFATNFFKDYLCRDLPVLRMSDIKPIKKSKISFKNRKDCMSCHQTTDNLALITRNLELFNAGEFSSKAFVFRAIEEHRTHTNKSLPVNLDKSFFKSNPSGQLNFRSFNGQLININLKNPNMLGEVIKELDDPYLCAVKRYFSFLTGVEVHIYDYPNFKIDDSQKKDLETRNFLISLAKELKEHQSLKVTMSSIINSSYYLEGL